MALTNQFKNLKFAKWSFQKIEEKITFVIFKFQISKKESVHVQKLKYLKFLKFEYLKTTDTMWNI